MLELCPGHSSEVQVGPGAGMDSGLDSGSSWGLSLQLEAVALGNQY